MARPTDSSPDRSSASTTDRSPDRAPASGGSPAAPDPAALTYEQARDELARVVDRLETGAATLEESLALWERGEALAARCQEWLDGARERLAAARGEGRDAGGARDADAS
ncbi:exodeoxyribonuclease VII small subunit [Cellulomonas shaoxiangyii]|uniref:Exodeoxyribonuclease 7 small subunit n=1 Tax=Cellulomonas shaoxiangyii TaxID=2566013 RepID=A0A4V1CMW5_9CELL|nr:exodeoxyribonuclease VII small subunit [Cellulomonas shaoxiangyii]QCB94365.1 exodeoxyribonuclease VII small subunit [Cellulomonas shaoxiangyii]TGY85204.1 exodeoxyribonuclease VII small subunit [Cellulomonas shaoxiangyii]